MRYVYRSIGVHAETLGWDFGSTLGWDFGSTLLGLHERRELKLLVRLSLLLYRWKVSNCRSLRDRLSAGDFGLGLCVCMGEKRGEGAKLSILP